MKDFMIKKIKLNNFAVAIVIFIVCVFLVSVILMQFKTVEETDITDIENMREAELRKSLAEWKSKYDVKKTNDDVKLDYFKIKNLKYIISFDRFDMIDVNEDNVEEQLIKIFKAAESNDANKYPIEIVFDENNLEYRK